MRPHTLDDFEDSARLWADPEVVRHISGRPSTREETWSRVLRYIGHWKALGYGPWVVRESATGAFVGEVGPADYHREISPPLDGTPEIGWVVVPSMWGKGYATEAVRASIAWAQARMPGIAGIACIIAPDNLVSIRVAEKSGFQLARETTYREQPALVFLTSAAPPGR